MRSFTVLLLSIASLFGSTPAPAAPPGHYSAQLVAESDDLIRLAIRRPFGWAWDRDAASELPRHPSPRPVSMESLGTPAAGLILLWTGKLLNEPRYVEAGKDAARAVSASVTPVGRVLSHPIFGPIAGGSEPATPVPDRSATCSGLGLLLASIDLPPNTTQPTPDGSTPDGSTPVESTPDAPTAGASAPDTSDPQLELIHRSAARSALWLARQLAQNGLWPSSFPAGPASPKTIRLVRFDSADYRDSTLALLLSFDLLKEDTLNRVVARPLDGLLKLRLETDAHGPNLWCTASTVGGTDIPTGFPNGPDVLASRFAMQTLLGAYLLTANADQVAALDQASATLAQVKGPDGLYDRFLDPTAAADVARSLGIDSPTSQPFFTHPTSKPTAANSVLASQETSGDFGIPELLDAQAKLKSIGRDRYVDSLNATISVHQQIEACLCGLCDDPFTLILPQSAKEVPAFLAAHADLWKLADGPAPNDLAGKLRRLWILYLRAKLERVS